MCPGACAVPTELAGALLIQRTTRLNGFVGLSSLIRVCFLAVVRAWLIATHVLSVIEFGAVCELEPYTCTRMPGVLVISSTAESLRLEPSLTSTPTAMRGALSGSTCAVQAVVVSPSIVRLGSPKPEAG